MGVSGHLQRARVVDSMAGQSPRWSCDLEVTQHQCQMSNALFHRILTQISGFPPSLPFESDPAFLGYGISKGQDRSGMDLMFNISVIFKVYIF